MNEIVWEFSKYKEHYIQTAIFSSIFKIEKDRTILRKKYSDGGNCKTKMNIMKGIKDFMEEFELQKRI